MSCTEEAETEPECKGIINSHLRIAAYQRAYAIDFEITNMGDKIIDYVKVIFVVTFSDGSIDQRTAYNPVVNVLPGETKDVVTMIHPQNQTPPNPRWINFEGEIVSVKFLDPEIVCAQ